MREVQSFDLPDDQEGEFRDLDNRRPAWEQIYTDARDVAGMAGRIAHSGKNLIEKSALFPTIEVEGWGSNNEGGDSDLAFQLMQVASVLRHDQAHAGSPSEQTGLSFFHVSIGGFDTHSEQGSDDGTMWHPTLLRWVSEAMTAFQRDLEALGLADKVVTVTYSEFGRRIEQNDSGRTAGTDHGTANCMLVMGDATVMNGGVLRTAAGHLEPRRPREHGHHRRLPAGLRDLDRPVAERQPRAAARVLHDPAPLHVARSTTVRLRGPWAPMTSACSMSAVFEGPATKLPKPGPGKRSRA